MFPVIQFLIAFFLAEIFLSKGAACWLCDGLWTPVGTVVVVLAILPVGVGLRRRLAWQLAGARGDPVRWERALLRGHRALSLFRGLPIVHFFVVCWVLGWPHYVAEGPLGGTILLDELAALLPFLAVQMLAWIVQFGLDRLMNGRRMALRPYLGFQWRQVLLPVVPVLGLTAIWDLIETSFHAQVYLIAFPFLLWMLVVAVLVLLYVFSGSLMRLIFRARPLPAGPLRERLEAFARRVDFRGRDLLVWNTGLSLINAAIIGGVRRWRYVLFTEGMLESFGDAEIEAVFAHEVGHAKGRHIHLYFLFALTLLFLYQLMVELLAAVAPAALLQSTLANTGLFVALVIIYWRAVFGFVSRRFEREADLFAAIAVGDHRRFTRALEAVARQAGALRTLPSWRHYSIAERVAFLERAFTDVNVLEAFRRTVREVKAVLVAVLVVAVVLALRNAGSDLHAGAVLLETVNAAEAGDPGRAAAAVRKALDDPFSAARLEDGVAYYCAVKGSRWLGSIVVEAKIERAHRVLDGGDFDGAARLLRDVLRSRRFWGQEAPDSVARLRRRLRQVRDGEASP